MNQQLPGVCAMAAVLAAAAFAGDDNTWEQSMDRGHALHQAGDCAAAAASYREAVRAAAADPASQGLRGALALNGVATQYQEMGRLADAEHEFRRALDVLVGAGGDHSLEFAQIESNLALLYLQKGQTARAEPMFREALAAFGPRASAADPQLMVARNGLAEVLIRTRAMTMLNNCSMQPSGRINTRRRGNVCRWPSRSITWGRCGGSRAAPQRRSPCSKRRLPISKRKSAPGTRCYCVCSTIWPSRMPRRVAPPTWKLLMSSRSTSRLESWAPLTPCAANCC